MGYNPPLNDHLSPPRPVNWATMTPQETFNWRVLKIGVGLVYKSHPPMRRRYTRGLNGELIDCTLHDGS